MIHKYGLRLGACFTILTALSATGQAISSFDPSIGSPGDTVFIYGSGFQPGTLAVAFNLVLDPSAIPNAGGTMITAHVPSGASTGSIGVQVNGGNPVFSSQDFTVVHGPFVTNFAPAVGSSRASVTLGGIHLLSASGAYFNGKPAFSFFPQSDSSILVQAPDGVTTGPITVVGPSGTNTTSSNFFVPPVITGFAPASGRTGTNVLVTGSNFLGVTAVRFGSTFSQTFNVLSNGAILVSVPTNAATGTMRVDAPGGSTISSSNFIVQPVIYAFTPNFGPVGTSINVTGANFNVGTPTIRFAGVSASVSGVLFGQLTVLAPAGAVTGPISIMTTDGSFTNSNNYFYPASITSFSPTNSSHGTIVTITGNNLLGTSAVAFNGAPAGFTTPTNNTTLLAVVPEGVTTGPITVTTPAGSTNSSGRFYAAPILNSFAPTHGLPGTNVVLAGTNFLGATAVTFNGSNSVFTVNNNGQITATVPTGAQTGPIAVFAPAGAVTNPTPFVLDYVADLSVNATAAPDPVTVGSNLVYTITILNGSSFPAAGVSLTNTLPGSALLTAASSTQGSLATNSNTVVASLGPLAAGHQAVVTLSVSPQTTGMITNIAVVGASTPDPSIPNNTAVTSTLVVPLPLLSIKFVPPNRVRLSWPVVLSNFNLEFKPLLAATNFWSNVPTASAITGAENVVNETNTSSMRFYRLRK